MTTPAEMNFPKDYFQILPKEIKQLLTSYLNPADLTTSATASKVFQAIASDNKLWVQIAKKYDIILKDPNHAKKEILDLFYNVHSGNVLAFKALEAERFKVDWKVVFSEQSNPFALRKSLQVRVENPSVQSYLIGVNQGIIKMLGIEIPVTGDPLVMHERIIQYMRSNLEKLQSKGLEILKEACQKHSHSPQDALVFETLVKHGIIGNNPSVSKKSHKDHWQEVFSIVLGDQHQFSAMKESDTLFESTLAQFKNAPFSPNAKLQIIRGIYKDFLVSRKNQGLIEQMMKIFPPDANILRTVISGEYNSKRMSMDKLTELFIKHSNLSDKELIKIVDQIEEEVVKQETLKYEEEDKKEIEAGREPESHTLDESMRSVKFESLRKAVQSQVKGF